MKLSTKILIGFFGFVFLYLTAAFAEIRFSGTPNVINNKNSIAETADISGGVTYLVLKNIDSQELKVIGSDRAEVEVRSFSGDVLKKLKYNVSGDTLTISGLEEEDDRRVRISVFVPNSNLKGISVSSATVILQRLQQERLSISAEFEARIWMSNSTIGKIETDLSTKSFMDITTTEVDTMSAKLDASQLFISTPVGLVQGSLKNASFLHLNETQEIQLKKDVSSNLNMN